VSTVNIAVPIDSMFYIWSMRDVAGFLVLFYFSPFGDIGWFTCWCARTVVQYIVLRHQTWTIVSQEEERSSLLEMIKNSHVLPWCP
jgi:hypothetical protein